MEPTEERRRNLSKVDLAAITDAVKAANRADDHCRFLNVTPEDLETCIKFCKHWNDIFESSAKTIWKTFLVLFVTAFFAIWMLGFWLKKGM